MSPFIILSLSFNAISYTTAELSWETTVISNSTLSVQLFFIQLYTNTSNVTYSIISFTSDSERLNATNLTKGVEYWFTVQAKDSLGYLSDVSPPLFFTLDGMCIIRLKMVVYLKYISDPFRVEVVNSSLVMRKAHDIRAVIIIHIDVSAVVNKVMHTMCIYCCMLNTYNLIHLHMVKLDYRYISAVHLSVICYARKLVRSCQLQTYTTLQWKCSSTAVQCSLFRNFTVIIFMLSSIHLLRVCHPS